MSKMIKVLHCPSLVGGNAQNIASAERELGLDSWSVAFKTNSFDYRCDEILWKFDDGVLKREYKRWKFFLKVLIKYDIIHFNFGSTIFPSFMSSSPRGVYRKFIYYFKSLYAMLFELCDLYFFKKFGKGIIVTYQGDDARQADFCINHFQITHAKEVGAEYFPKGSDEIKRRRIKKFDKYADRIYSLNPDLMHVLPSRTEFLPYGNVNLNEWKYIDRGSKNPEIPLVIHAPSHRGAKGTKYILDAVDNLKQDDIPFEFILIEGMSNKEARKIYEKADILIDQLLVGWYGGLAVELMALGKPVICYIRSEDLKFIPVEMCNEIPVINANNDTIYSVLKECLTSNKNNLSKIGKLGREYVEKWHDPIKIAEKLKIEYEKIYQIKFNKK
jgi:hypothetical protein